MSIKRNFAYSSILTISSYLFPLITYPYVSRTLGVSGIGIVNFVDSIIDYAILISMMGISIVGIREIASCKNDKEKRSNIFSSLLVLNSISTIIAIIIVAMAMFIIPQLQPYKELLSVGLCKLLMNLFLTEWLFIGMEDFPYITKRSLFVKCIYIASIFIFIQDKTNISTYYILTVSSVVINALINIRYARRFVHFSFKNIKLKPYLKIYFSNGFYKLVTSLYLSLNIAWLGIITDTIQVGYYTTATKLYTIIIALFTAFTSVMLPRLSSLLSEGKTTEFWQKIQLSFEAILFFSFPVITFCIINGDSILSVLVGKGFEGSYLPFRLIMPLILVIGFSQIFVLQILLPMKKDNIVLRNAIIGALTSIIINLIIVKHLGAVGSAITWICSESIVAIASYVTICSFSKLNLPYKRFLEYLAAYTPIVIFLLISHYYLGYNNLLLLAITGGVALIYTFIIQKKYLKSEIFYITLNHIPIIKNYN
ncbi:MAG: oligosaccharide flippase family protein [Prevotella sp.]|nr:oligosaccharide flippase family protein [Candidatus Prevotella equi]